jgi:hypothetical protein
VPSLSICHYESLPEALKHPCILENGTLGAAKLLFRANQKSTSVRFKLSITTFSHRPIEIQCDTYRPAAHPTGLKSLTTCRDLLRAKAAVNAAFLEPERRKGGATVQSALNLVQPPAPYALQHRNRTARFNRPIISA